MIKEQSFEWLLEGCHRIADVAVAITQLRVCLLGRKGPAPFHCGTRLPAEGSDGPGYTARTAHLTPVQIGILLSYWGMPDHVKDMTVKKSVSSGL